MSYDKFPDRLSRPMSPGQAATLRTLSVEVSTPERSCIGSPERRCINDDGKKAPNWGLFRQASGLGEVIRRRV
jgi:hypothetical protein